MQKKQEFHLKPGGLGAKVPVRLSPRPLAKVSPRREQFEPTIAAPVNSRNRMSGVK